jgi:hypothetical protein
VLNGDFGRVRPELVTDDMHAWIGRDAVDAVGLPPSAYPLTDDERLLRDLAYPLIEPPYDRNRWYSVIGEYGFARGRPPDTKPVAPADYWVRLVQTYRRSEASAYAQVITDARNDVLRIDPFFAVANRVVDMDRRRAQSLAYVSELSEAERANALIRNGENNGVIAWTCRALHVRAAAYRFALERLVITVPSPTAVDGERAVDLLRRQIGVYCQPGPRGALVAKR